MATGKLIYRLALVSAISGAMLASSAAVAFAHDDEDSSESTAKPRPTGYPSGIASPRPRPTSEEDAAHEREELEHHLGEIHDKFGADIDQIFLPPLVIKSSGVGGTSTTTSSQAVSGTQLTTNLIPAADLNPAVGTPVNTENMVVSDRTPADVFFEAATFGTALMGFGAAGLGSVAVVQRARQRRNRSN